MFITLQETVEANVATATDEFDVLLAGLGFDAGRLDLELELAIVQFDQWTNQRDAVLLNTCGDYETDNEPERVK